LVLRGKKQLTGILRTAKVVTGNQPLQVIGADISVLPGACPSGGPGT
jgi:hypothetical protein